MGTRCRTIDKRLSEPDAFEALKTADVIVGCLDNLHARADLQELSWRFLIPYVDVGVNIRAINDPEPDGPRVSIGGNVLTLIPGGFCMWCCGFLSKEKLEAELAGPNRNYFENRAGEAQVVSLNGVAASRAVTEVLQLLTGFAGRGLRQADVAMTLGAPNIVTRDAQNREVVLAAKEVEELRPSRTSLMPEGQLAGLTAQEAADLLEYLATRK